MVALKNSFHARFSDKIAFCSLSIHIEDKCHQTFPGESGLNSAEQIYR